MEVHFKPELESKLNRAAVENHCGPDEYVQQLVEQYLDYDVWFRGKVDKSLERLDRGEFLTSEQVNERIEKLFADR